MSLAAVLTALVLMPRPEAPPDTTATPPGARIVTAAAIDRAGLVRPAELFRLVDGWTYGSVNGFDVHAFAPGTAPDAPYGWEVWIDGAPAAVDLLGVRDLNHLPLALHDVAYVEVVDRPHLAGGRIVSGGRLHIHTRRAEGLSVRGGFCSGDDVTPEASEGAVPPGYTGYYLNVLAGSAPRTAPARASPPGCCCGRWASCTGWRWR